MIYKRLNAPKKRLIQLYLREKLSTEAIGKILGCHHVTVLNYLRQYGIPRRSKLGNRRPVSIPKKVLFYLYRNKKLTQKEIAQKFGHSRYGIQRWMKVYGIQARSCSVAHTKYQKNNFNGSRAEKAYIMGFRLGDLNVSKIHDLIRVRCSSTKKEQISLIRSLFKKYGHVHVWQAKRDTFEIVILLNQSFTFLLPKNDLVENWILGSSKYFLSFLAGYADAEGSYYLRKPYYKFAKSGWGIFEIQTYDKNILHAIFKKLESMGINSTFSKSKVKGYVDKRGIKHNQDAWRLTIVRKQSLWNFIKLIEPYQRHQKNLENLAKVKDNLLLRNRLPYCKPITL